MSKLEVDGLNPAQGLSPSWRAEEIAFRTYSKKVNKKDKGTSNQRVNRAICSFLKGYIEHVSVEGCRGTSTTRKFAMGNPEDVSNVPTPFFRRISGVYIDQQRDLNQSEAYHQPSARFQPIRSL